MIVDSLALLAILFDTSDAATYAHAMIADDVCPRASGIRISGAIDNPG